MKEKIQKILGNPKTVLPVVLVVALVVGIIVYKLVGNAPKVGVLNDTNSDTSSLANETGYADGQEVDLAFPKSGRVNQVLVKTGDKVKKGAILASLDYKDAEGALEIARANYQRILNGATGPDIDVAKAAVQTAQVAYDQAKVTQDTLVKNARLNYLNSGLSATPQDPSNTNTPPTVSGAYDGPEGRITITTYNSGSDSYFTTTGLVNVVGKVDSTIPRPIGDSGLLVKFSNTASQLNWVIDFPNKQGAGYLASYNAYQSALSTHDQVVANAEALLAQAKSALLLKQASARPEDVSSARGAMLSAEGAYNNDFIYAPEDGVINVVNIKVGGIALTNQKAIGMTVELKN